MKIFGKYKISEPVKGSDPFVIQNGKYRDSKLQALYRPGWAEDVFLADTREKDKIGKSFDIAKLPAVLIVFAVALSLIIAKTAWLQVAKKDYYYSMAEGNRIRIERIEPKRGIIYDRNGMTLVRNKANFLLYFVPADLPAAESEKANILNRVSQILGAVMIDDRRAALAGIKKNSLEAYRPLFIADNIEYDKAMLLYLESADWPGVVLSSKTNREYLFTPAVRIASSSPAGEPLTSLSHLLGYTGKINDDELNSAGDEYLPIDYIGKMGIEYFWENQLRGKSGTKQIEVDALGKEKKIIGESPAAAGQNLVLSLDLGAQLELEEILRAKLKELKLTKAAAVVMDPSSGEVIAMVSLPAFDNNRFAQGISQADYDKLTANPDQPLFNRSISGEYPSGSTIKPIMAAAALEEGIITEHTTISSVGGIRIGEWFFPDWKAGGHGLTDVKRALAESINTFFYYIGGGYENFRGLGLDRIVAYEKLFGLDAETGIDLAGEASGFLPSADWKEKTKGERWYIGDTYHISIGQGDLLVTPLQVAAYTSVFANGGALYRPHLVRAILGSNDQLVGDIINDPVRQDFIKPGNIAIVRAGMRQTVTSGSARSLGTVPVAVAGKTGTAQWSEKKPAHAWFTGFAPFDHPQIVITILIEQGGEGSAVAVPVAKEFLNWYFSNVKLKNQNAK